jgi:hypothetical protein
MFTHHQSFRDEAVILLRVLQAFSVSHASKPNAQHTMTTRRRSQNCFGLLVYTKQKGEQYSTILTIDNRYRRLLANPFLFSETSLLDQGHGAAANPNPLAFNPPVLVWPVPLPSRVREGHFKRFASVASLLSPRPRPPPRRFRDSRPQLPPPLYASHWTLVRSDLSLVRHSCDSEVCELDCQLLPTTQSHSLTAVIANFANLRRIKPVPTTRSLSDCPATAA